MGHTTEKMAPLTHGEADVVPTFVLSLGRMLTGDGRSNSKVKTAGSSLNNENVKRTGKISMES